jgi:hypothetical protein
MCFRVEQSIEIEQPEATRPIRIRPSPDPETGHPAVGMDVETQVGGMNGIGQG